MKIIYIFIFLKLFLTSAVQNSLKKFKKLILNKKKLKNNETSTKKKKKPPLITIKFIACF